MYQILYKHKKIATIIMGIATFGFLLWLFVQDDSFNFMRSGKCVAEADGICITLSEYRREMLRYSSFLGNKEIEDVIKQQVIENLIVQSLLYKKSRELGFIASDEEVIRTIKLDPTFQENGVFSSYKYREILSSNGLEANQYEEYIRKILSIQKLLTFIQNSVYMTQEEIRINQAVNNTEVSGRLYILSPNDVKEFIQVSEKELMEYYERNKDRFKTESKKSYKLWIVEGDKEKASSIYRSLKNNQDVPNFTIYTLPDDSSKLDTQIIKTMENLSEKDPLTVTKIDNKYYVIQLQNLEKTSYKSFNEVRKELESEILNLKKSEILSKRANELAESLRKTGNINAKYVVFDFTPISRIVGFLKMNQEDVIKLAFSKDKVFGPYSMVQGYGILYIEAKRDTKDESSGVDTELINLKANSVVNMYIDNLLKSTKVRVNKEML